MDVQLGLYHLIQLLVFIIRKYFFIFIIDDVFFFCRTPKDSVRNEIQRLVKSFPLQVRHIPDALSIFTAAGDHDRQCEVNLKIIKVKTKTLLFQTSHILTWAPVNPVAALSYFASARLNQVANSYTIQFASRILYTTKPEALILYIPQLVQAVRYDEVEIFFLLSFLKS